MSGVNKVIIMGRLGRDPEISYTQGGLAICKFSLATSKKKKDGEEITSWHRCTAFDKRGEIIAQYMSKGRMLYIEGELSYGQYEKDGITRYTTDIIVYQFAFVDSRGDSQDNYQQGGGGFQQGRPQQGGNFQQNRPQPQGGYQGGGAPPAQRAPQPSTGPDFPDQGPDFPGGAPPEDDIPF